MDLDEEIFTPAAPISTPMGPTSITKVKRQAAAENNELEQMLGRRLPSGTMRLKKLSQVHMKIISMHLHGMKSSKISESLFAQGVKMSQANIYKILQDPLAKTVVEDFRESWNEELLSLGSLAVDAVRVGLNNGDVDVKLKAVDRFVKLKAVEEEKRGPNMQINIVDARTKLVNIIQDVAGPLLDITPTPEPAEG